MICANLFGYERACGPVSGGISDIGIFDPNDYNFTQPAAIAGRAQPYSAMTLRAGAVGTGTSAATCTVTVETVGDNGDDISVYFRGTLLGTFEKTATEVTVAALATALAAAITAGTHGFSAAAVAGVITITAPLSYGAGINGESVVVEDSGAIETSKTSFGAGVTGTGGKVKVVKFQQDEAEWNWKQSVKGCSTKYEHSFNFQLPENSQTLTTFMSALDSASCCCGIGLIFRLNDGKIMVAGEKYVNNQSIARFTVINNGSSGGTGKLIDDVNSGNMVLVGSYTRSLFQFSGSWADVEALM